MVSSLTFAILSWLFYELQNVPVNIVLVKGTGLMALKTEFSLSTEQRQGSPPLFFNPKLQRRPLRSEGSSVAVAHSALGTSVEISTNWPHCWQLWWVLWSGYLSAGNWTETTKVISLRPYDGNKSWSLLSGLV